VRAGRGLREHLQRGMSVVRSAGPRVQAIGDAIEIFLAEDAEVRALGQALSDEPVGVLAGAALPGAVRARRDGLQLLVSLGPLYAHTLRLSVALQI